ncbi:MAG: NUDIX domain-containing protein [archaeon]
MNKKIEGVVAIIEKDGKYLLGLESKDSPIKGKWRLLGGKLEKGETPEQALHRELMEEASIEIKVVKYLFDIKAEHSDILIYVFLAKYLKGNLKPRIEEHESIKWFSLEEVKSLNLAKTTKEIIERYLGR